MGTYVVTGGASGIGAAITARLRNDGHTVLVVDIQEADIKADLSTVQGREAAVVGIREATTDGIAGLVACAGVGSHVPNKPLITEVNYFGKIDLVEGLRDHLAANNAAVVLVSSNSAPHPTNDDFVEQLVAGEREKAIETTDSMEAQPVYSGSKQAVVRWMRANTGAYAAEGVRINAIAPGYTRTPLSLAVEDDPNYGEAIKQFIATIPVGRPGVPEDMANATAFLLGDEAGFICGSTLFIDGGHDAVMFPNRF